MTVAQHSHHNKNKPMNTSTSTWYFSLLLPFILEWGVSGFLHGAKWLEFTHVSVRLFSPVVWVSGEWLIPSPVKLSSSSQLIGASTSANNYTPAMSLTVFSSKQIVSPILLKHRWRDGQDVPKRGRILASWRRALIQNPRILAYTAARCHVSSNFLYRLFWKVKVHKEANCYVPTVCI